MATNTELLDVIDTTERSRDRWRKKFMEAGERTMAVAATLGGAGVAGWLDGKYPNKKIAGMEISLAGGLLFAGLGLFKVGGRFSSLFFSFGTGMLATVVYRMVLKKQGRTSVQGNSVGALPSGMPAPGQFVTANTTAAPPGPYGNVVTLPELQNQFNDLAAAA